MKKVDKVLAGKSGKKKASPAPKPRHRETRFEHHEDGAFTGRHTFHPGEDGKVPDEVSWVAKDLDELHDRIEEHLGEPNHDEEDE